MPELAHNSIVGFDAPPVLRWAVRVVILHGAEPVDASARRRSVVEELAASGTAYDEIGLQPDRPLAEAFAGIILGDWVSYHLAIVLGVDPTPVKAIVRYKAKLAGP